VSDTPRERATVTLTVVHLYDVGVAGELRDVADGLWLWRVEYPGRPGGEGWRGPVASVCVESEGEVILIDPLAPAPDSAEIWERIEGNPPTAVVVLKPDHVRDVDLFVRRYGARGFGPWLFWRDDIPRTELESIEPEPSCQGVSSLCTTAAAGTRRRYGYRISGRWCSPIR
jgi:Metallo-beta-lactamase superfamily